MPNEKDLINLRLNLKNVFAFPITNLTFMQVQKAVLDTIKNREDAKQILQILLTGSFQTTPGEEKKDIALKTIIDEFCILARVANDVQERGEQFQFATSEKVEKPGGSFNYHQFRRVDGKEFSFYTDTKSSLMLVEHFLMHLTDNDLMQEAEHKEKLKELSRVIQERTKSK